MLQPKTLHRRSTTILATIFLLTGASAETRARPQTGDQPVATDPRLEVERFAASPDIVHPIALDFDSAGRLLVVESHTHFRPATYDGPKADRIRILEDTDGDGKADRFTTYFEGTVATMDLAVHPDGSVYVATRNEIIRLQDTDADGRADEAVRLVLLDTKGNYPHNGLSGLAFDAGGDLNFGIGENLGETYRLVGSDGTTLTGGGEGGNVFHCTADGGKLRRVATGFWNPFGATRDIFGRLFVVDNDPDASPPCRLVQVVEGGDYGFQFQYGRSGRHVFQAWNGEIPGTLPYVAGTGESPCEVVSYESDGLPPEYRGNLLVPVWADHRVERYVPQLQGAGIIAERKRFVQGGRDFRPSGLAVAPDGSLFVSDWVSQSYELHGLGAVWHIRWKGVKVPPRPTDPRLAVIAPHRPTREAGARALAQDAAGRKILRDQLSSQDVRVQAAALTALIGAGDKMADLDAIAAGDADLGLREMAVRELVARGVDVAKFATVVFPPSVRAEAIRGLSGHEGGKALAAFLSDKDPFLRHAAIQRLAHSPDLLDTFEPRRFPNAKDRVALLLAWRASGSENAPRMLGEFINDPDPEVRFLAAKWISDERLVNFRPQIVASLESRDLDARALIALTTAQARVDNQSLSEDRLVESFLERVSDPTVSRAARLLALRAVPAGHGKLTTPLLLGLLQEEDPQLRIDVLRALKDRADVSAAPKVRQIAEDENEPLSVRAQALVTLAAQGPETDWLVELAVRGATTLRHEALRALVGSDMTEDQRDKLLASLRDQTDGATLIARVLGQPFYTQRPPLTDTDSWLERLKGPADLEAGRRVFEHPKLSGCAKCHVVDGRGASVGPDLSLIGRTDQRWIVESLLQPNTTVAPHYQTWVVVTTDGRVRTGLLVRTYLDESEYVDEKGDRFKVMAVDVAESHGVPRSLMPEGLIEALTDQELRDLVAFLASRK